MKTTHGRLTIALLAALLVATGVGSLIVLRARSGGSQAAASVEYFCAMHPQIVRERPGECPVCGMKLERRAKAAGTGSAPAPAPQGAGQVPGRSAVTLPPDRVALLGIRSEPVGSAITATSLRTVGRVAVDERRREVVHAKYDGYVERLMVGFTGQPVSKGQPLLAIYSPELVAAQQEYLVARRAQERLSGSGVPGVAQGGRDLVEAARQRLASWDLGPAAIASLEQTGTPSRQVTVHSPVSGVVTAKLAFEGMRVSPADRLYEIADLSRVWVLAQVSEKDLPAVRVGMPVRVVVPDQPGKEWRGSVAFVSPTVAPETRTAETRVELDNPGGVLKPEMFVDVHLEAAPTSSLTVPEAAVIFTGERTLVFVDRGNGVFEPREIGVGPRTAQGYGVLNGLAAGERVVISANFLLDSESSLRAAIARTERRH